MKDSPFRLKDLRRLVGRMQDGPFLFKGRLVSPNVSFIVNENGAYAFSVSKAIYGDDMYIAMYVSRALFNAAGLIKGRAASVGVAASCIDRIATIIGWGAVENKEAEKDQGNQNQAPAHDGQGQENRLGETSRDGSPETLATPTWDTPTGDGHREPTADNAQGDPSRHWEARDESSLGDGDKQPEMAAAAGQSQEEENLSENDAKKAAAEAASSAAQGQTVGISNTVEGEADGKVVISSEAFGGVYIHPQTVEETARQMRADRFTRRLAKALHKLAVKEISINGDPSPRLNGKKLTREIAGRSYRLAKAHREDMARESVVVAIDVSGSCSSFCQELASAALACAMQNKQIVYVPHSNGFYKPVHDDYTTNWMPLLRKNNAKTIIWFGDGDGHEVRRTAKAAGARLIFMDNYLSSAGPQWPPERQRDSYADIHIIGVGGAHGALVALKMALNKGGINERSEIRHSLRILRGNPHMGRRMGKRRRDAHCLAVRLV